MNNLPFTHSWNGTQCTLQHYNKIKKRRKANKLARKQRRTNKLNC